MRKATIECKLTDILSSLIFKCWVVLSWHHGHYFIETPGDYTIEFVGIRGSGIHSDLAIDDITLGVSFAKNLL